MTEIRPVTPGFAVLDRPLHPEDVATIAAAGYVRIINNRPDIEVPPADRGATIAAACAEAGIDYVALPFGHAGLDPRTVDEFATALQAPGPVLGYCRSGTRSTTLWSLAQARSGMAVDDILTAARAAGYDLEHLRPMLTTLAG